MRSTAALHMHRSSGTTRRSPPFSSAATSTLPRSVGVPASVRSAYVTSRSNTNSPTTNSTVDSALFQLVVSNFPDVSRHRNQHARPHHHRRQSSVQRNRAPPATRHSAQGPPDPQLDVRHQLNQTQPHVLHHQTQSSQSRLRQHFDRTPRHQLGDAPRHARRQRHAGHLHDNVYGHLHKTHTS